MPTLLESKNGMRSLALKAQACVDNAEMTQAEKKVELDKLEVDLKTFSDSIAMWEQAERLIKGGDAADDAKAEEAAIQRAKGIGQQVVESEAYRNALVAKSNGGRFAYATEVKVPGIIDEGTTFANGFPTGAAGATIMPDYLPGIVELKFRKLLIADLFAQGSTSSNQISYVKETAFNNSAAGVAEKGKKPLSDDIVARVVEQVGKIAHLMKMTDEMIEDAPAFRSFLENRLMFGVKLKEDSELLVGTGYPSVPGLLGRSGFQTDIAAAGTDALGGATTVIDAVYKQITAIRFNAFVEPDAIVIDPLNWQHVQLGKDLNGQYYAGGPFMGSYGNGQYTNVMQFWGLKTVVTPAPLSSKIVVGGFQECGQVFRRSGITVELTNSNVDDFENNLITARGEERLALAIYRAGGFGTVTPTWT
ncbi:MAG: hypothetical protein QOH56_4349 [Pseudonocardiales bacterium]|nr:hypothetical protein [Pseudonocardiales bacterium]